MHCSSERTACLLLALVSGLPSLPAGEAVHELPDYVVKAWHFDRDTLDIPADVVRIERDAIENSLAATVPDLLAERANLYFTRISGRTNVAMRGFGEGSGLRTLILVDGQPLNPADMGRINWEQVPLDSVESVEVLRGGHNVLYGDKALAGVIKIETRRTGEERLEAEGSLGRFGYRQAALSGAFGSRSWSVQAGASLQEEDGYRDNSEASSHNLYTGFGYSFSTGVDIDVRVSAGEVFNQYPGGLSREQYRSNPRQSDPSFEGDEATTDYRRVSARMEGGDAGTEWEILAGYDWEDTEWVLTGSGRNRQERFSLKPRVKRELEDWTVIGGVDGSFDRVESTLNASNSINGIAGEAELEEWRVAPYGYLERLFGERLSVSGGARAEWVGFSADYVDGLKMRTVCEEDFFGNLNCFVIEEDGSFSGSLDRDGFAAELSASYRLAKGLSLWAGYDRVYRYPVFDERVSYQGFEQAELFNSELEAEEGDSYELGLKRVGRDMEVYLTGFLLDMENEIFYDQAFTGSSGFSGLNVNLGPVRRMGVDLAWIYRRERWGLDVSIAYVDTELRSGEGKGNPVPLVPEWRTTSRLWFRPYQWLECNVTHRYVDDRNEGGDVRAQQAGVESYHLLDAGVSAAVNPNASVFARIDNVLDEDYLEGVYFGAHYPGTGRALRAGVRFRF